MATKRNLHAATAKLPRFKNEAEEAAWLASPAGRRFLQERRAAARAKGVVVYEGGFNEEAREILRSGKSVIFQGGMGVTPTDPAKLQELDARAKAKSTEQIALRLPTADLEAAKRLAAKHGIGYQTLLKEIIHDALRQAS